MIQDKIITEHLAKVNQLSEEFKCKIHTLELDLFNKLVKFNVGDMVRYKGDRNGKYTVTKIEMHNGTTLNVNIPNIWCCLQKVETNPDAIQYHQDDLVLCQKDKV